MTLTVKKNLKTSCFVLALVHAINSSGGLRLVDDEEDTDVAPEGLQVTADEIEIALPKNRETPYDNAWFVATDEALQSLVFNDYDLLAFKFADDENFRIEALEYAEPN